MRGNVKRRLAAFTAVVVGMGGGLFVTSQSEAGGGPKSYTVAASPARLTAGSAGQLATIALTNTSRNAISFSAVNFLIPTGLTVISPSLLDAAPGVASVEGSVLKLRDLTTPKDATVTVQFTVVASVQQTCSAYVFASDVRQSNDFNGQNNKFALSGTDATFSGPCSSSTVTCTAGDSRNCTTGVVQSTGGNTAEVLLNDGDGVSATLSASLVAANFTCAEYSPTSDRLNFNVAITYGSLTNVTKTVTFSQPVPVASQLPTWQYQACFQAPYDFPALLPSQLPEDFANGNFANNTIVGTGASTALYPTGTYTGLLLPCSAGYGVPCLGNPLNFAQPGVTISGERVSITVTVPAKDPGMRF